MVLKVSDPNDLINALSLMQAKNNERKTNKPYEPYVNTHASLPFKIGRIPADYVTPGRPSVIFEGESAASLKKYAYLGSYTPAASDWVLLANVGTTYVILGKIT